MWESQVTAAHAHAYDSIQIKDSAGNLMAWFYTSCKCDKTPGTTAVPASEHTLRVWKWAFYVSPLSPPCQRPSSLLLAQSAPKTPEVEHLWVAVNARSTLCITHSISYTAFTAPGWCRCAQTASHQLRWRLDWDVG